VNVIVPVSDSLLGSSIRVAVRTFDATRTKRTFMVAIGLGPILQVLYLVAIAEPATASATIRTVSVTASLLTAAIAAVEAMTLTVNQARYDGTLPALMLSPRAGNTIWIGGTTAAAAAGLCAGLTSLTAASLIYGSSVGTYFAAAVLMLVTAVASGGLGFAVGVLTLPFRSGLSWTVIVVGVMTVLGGVVAPVEDLPGPARMVSRTLPLSHATQAARMLVDHGMSTDAVLSAALGLVVGTVWFVIGVMSWALVARSSRERGTFDLL
jgi:ABC-type multidrug transport system permease subunit